MPPKKRTCAASPVLGSDTDYVERTATGRPARRSTGRTSLPAGYVPTDAAFDQQNGDHSASDSGFEDSEDELSGNRTAKKRKRTSPTPSLNSDSECEVEQLSRDEASDDDIGLERLPDSSSTTTALPEISLTFNVPHGEHQMMSCS